MSNALRAPIMGVIFAIVINATMDATGLSGISFASLLPLALACWAFVRLPRKSMGLAFGGIGHYGLAILQPLLVIGMIALVTFMAGGMDIGKSDWMAARNNFLSMFAVSIPLAVLTEEFFFRGWLFGSLQKAGMSESRVMLWTAIAFSLWHIPAVAMNTEDALPPAQIPVLLANAVLIGYAWAMLRSISGSIIVTGVCHAFWNASVYVLFGYGSTIGVLGVEKTAIYGPESGLLGLLANLALAAVLWAWWERRKLPG